MKSFYLFCFSVFFTVFSFGQCIPPSAPSAFNDTIVCGSTAQLLANGSSGQYAWYDQPTGGTFLGNGSPFITPPLTSTTNYYVEATLGGASTMMPHNAHSSIYTGNVRGYWFVAPCDFTITGLKNPPEISGLQNIAVVSFPTTPPTFSATTNTFTTLFLTQNDPTVGIIPVSIPITSGTVVGILGQAGTQNSYTAGPVSSNINGLPVTLTRLGMQFQLGSNSPQSLWTEPSGSISRTEMYYEINCSSTRTMATAVVDPVNINIDAPAPGICAGDSITLTASGGSSYLWNNGETSSNIIVSPGSSTTYAVSGTNAQGCSATGTFEVLVSPPPSMNISASQNPICQGDSVTISSTGSTQVSWNFGEITQNISVAPDSNTVYIVTGDNNGCTASAAVMIEVNDLPNIDVSVMDTTICAQEPIYLEVTGGNSYAWSNGSTDSTLTILANQNMVLSVQGIDANGCVGENQVDITVLALPDVNAGADIQVCEGQDVVLSGSGAQTYQWNNGVQDGVSFGPNMSSYYVLQGTDLNGCSQLDSVLITVLENSTSTQVESAIDSFYWDVNQQTYTSSGTYSATITNAAGCDSTITLELTMDFTGINSNDIVSLGIVPNPTNGLITISGLGNSSAEYKIFNQLGAQITSGLTDKNEAIDLTEFAPGIYYIELLNYHSKKLIVVKN